MRGLRPPHGSLDLEQAFSLVQHDIAPEGGIVFRVVVNGRPRELNSFVRDEVYRIGREAVANAFRHSGATTVEIETTYAARSLRVVVRDDGCGIDPRIVESGREAHWGLSGMRERAESIGARLRVWSKSSAGAEVELSVPGRIAFQNQSSRFLATWRRVFSSAHEHDSLIMLAPVADEITSRKSETSGVKSCLPEPI